MSFFLKVLIVWLLACQMVSANSSFGPVNVKQVSITDANKLVVTIATDGASQHDEPCDEDKKLGLMINPDSPHYKEMFSLALTAKVSGKRIKGWVNGCVSWWNYKSPKLTFIALVD